MKHKPLSKKQIKILNKAVAEKVDDALELVFILQSVEDPINVGSFFRTADAFGVKKVYLTGSTPTPPQNAISMTSRGMERKVNWEYLKKVEDSIKEVRKTKFEIIALELTSDSKIYSNYKFSNRVCLVFGNEASGVFKKTLSLCDASVCIPMLGKGPSLNVHVAGAIAAAEVVSQFTNK